MEEKNNMSKNCKVIYNQRNGHLSIFLKKLQLIHRYLLLDTRTMKMQEIVFLGTTERWDFPNSPNSIKPSSSVENTWAQGTSMDED